MSDVPESSEPETKSKSVWKEHIWSTFIHRLVCVLYTAPLVPLVPLVEANSVIILVSSYALVLIIS